MSDRPIQAGDLVQVVRTCCRKHAYGLGAVFTVSAIEHNTHRCAVCGYYEGHYAGSTSPFLRDCDRAPLHWLKRIPPLEELEGQREEQREPVLLDR